MQVRGDGIKKFEESVNKYILHSGMFILKVYLDFGRDSIPIPKNKD
jgi:hypothetical protein